VPENRAESEAILIVSGFLAKNFFSTKWGVVSGFGLAPR
jgi:hypothetical protein